MAKKTYSLEVDVEASSQTLDQAIKKMEQMIVLKGQLSGGIIEIPDSNVKKIVETKTQIDGLTESIKKQKVVISDIEKAQIKLKKAQSDEAKQLAALNLEINKQNKANREAAVEADKNTNAYERLSRTLLKNQKAVKDLLASKKQLTAEDKKLIAETQALDKQLKQIDETVGDGRRSVGLYRQAIKDALNETGLFTGVLGQAANGFVAVQKAEEAAGKGAKSFETILKASGIFLVISALALLGKIITTVVSNTQNFQDQLEGTKFGAAALSDEVDNFIDTLQKSRPALRQISKDIQELVNDDQDLKDIVNDQTVSIGLRDAALQASISLSKKKADLEIKAAQINLNNINAEVKAFQKTIGNQDVLEDLLIKQVEAENKVSEAKSNRATVDAESARRQRQLAQEAIINNVELTRSNKLTANARAVELQNALNDEKRQLEERKKIGEELQRVNIATIDAEAKELEKAGISRKLFNEAVATGDEVQLKNLIRKKAANIEGTAIEQELFKVVKQAQENEIRNNELIKKQQEEEIVRKQKIQDINNQILINQSEFEISEIERLEAERLRLYEETNTEILREENLFNHKLHKQREREYEFQLANAVALYEKQVELLQLRGLAEIDEIYRSEKDEKVRNKKIEELQLKHNQELEKLTKDEAEKELAIQRKKVEDDKKIQQAQVTYAAQRLDYVTDLINQQLEKRSQAELDRIDNEEQRNDEALQRQIQRAEEGKENDVETYALKQAELEKAKAEQQKKDLRREKILSYYNLLSGYAKTDANTALTKAVRDIAISEGISAAFAAKGGIVGEVSDTTTLGSSKTHGAGMDRIVVADKREGILNVQQMQNLGGREGFYNLQSMLNNPLSDNILFPEVPVFINTNATRTDNLERKMDEMIQAINNKPVPSSRLDKDMNVITETIIGNNRHILNSITKKPPLRRV